LVNLVKRQQGLLVKKGNPLRINGLEDLTRPEVRFINRQKGSGTRVLLDYLMNKENIKPQQINGYNREEFTHLAVAASIKNDACDTGLAIFASARVMGLDFIPLEMERYDLCILPELMTNHNLDHLLEAISSETFKNQVAASGGYELDLSGKIIYQNY
jgi:putative molybdopterin biosynthesis protein